MKGARASADTIDLPLISEALARVPPRIHAVDPERHASVAMIIEPGMDDYSVLFIERARKDSDPWSGQIAFPGGRREPEDPDSRAVAVRETAEEIGVLLKPSQYIGRLDDLKGRHGGTSEGMVISCFVYHLETPVEVTPNYEVAAVERLPIRHLVDSAHRTEIEWKDAELRRFPGIRFGENDARVVWGLTYRFLCAFFHRLGYCLPEDG